MTLMTIAGYACIFNCLSSDLGGFRERIAVRGFDLSGGVAINLHHWAGTECASTRAGTAAAWQDDYGLAVRFQLPETPEGIALREGIRAGRHSGLSVGFCGSDDRERWETIEGQKVRTVLRARIDHIAITATPLYPDTLCWAMDEDPADMPPAIAALARRWRMSEARETLPKPAPRKRPRPQLRGGLWAMASADRDAWLRAEAARQEAIGRAWPHRPRGGADQVSGDLQTGGRRGHSARAVAFVKEKVGQVVSLMTDATC